MRLSIIIPVYNAVKYLADCLDSVCAQTYTDFEVICIDDGSTDGSAETLDGYAAKDMRIKVVHQKNTGAWAARNAALEIARGEWIAFVDADDRICQEWFDAAMKLADSSGADIVRLRPTCGGFGGGEVGVREGGAAAEWAWRTLSEYGYLWLCFIRRSVISDLRFRPINCKEDGIFLMELIPRLRRTCQGVFAGYEYRSFAGSLTKCNRSIAQCVAYLNAYRDIWLIEREWAETMGVSKLVRQRLRQGADHDVWEWFHLRKKEDLTDSGTIRAAYLQLEESGALWPDWCHRKRRLMFPFGLWRATGSWLGFCFLEWMEEVVRRIR